MSVGEQTSLRRQVAVKIDSRPLDSERNRRRFVREMSAASRISGHPHVVTLIDAGVLPDGRPYLVMERCDGGSLASTTRHPIPAAEAVRIIEAVSGALGAAHAAGVLHRDIKPGNILLDSYGSPRLSDFGIAAIQRDEQQDASVTLEAMTPAFAPPEAFNMEPPTAAGDVWSMGAVLLTLITGRGPRTNPQGRNHSLTEIYHGLTLPVDITSPLVPQALKPVLAKAMNPDPAQRYQSGAELAAALSQALPQLTTARTPTGNETTTAVRHEPPVTPVGPPAMQAPAHPQPQPANQHFAAPPGAPLAPAPAPTRRPWLWVICGGLAVVALGASFLVWGLPALTSNSATGSTTTPIPSTSSTTDSQTSVPTQVSESDIPSSPDMPWALGTCMRGWVDESGISNSTEVSCEEANWRVFAGGTFAADNPATSAEEFPGEQQQGRHHAEDRPRGAQGVRDALSKHLFEQTKRRPVILPIIMEASNYKKGEV